MTAITSSEHTLYSTFLNNVLYFSVCYASLNFSFHNTCAVSSDQSVKVFVSLYHGHVIEFFRYFFVFRVFSDRLVDAGDHEAFVSLLSDKLGTMFDLTFHNLCPNKQPPIFGRLLIAEKKSLSNESKL